MSHVPGGVAVRSALTSGSPYPTDAQDRVRQDAADQDDAYPFIIFRRVAIERLRGLDGSLHAILETFHVECWGETREQSDELEAQVVAALEAAGYYPGENDPDGIDPEVRVKAAVVAVDIWS